MEVDKYYGFYFCGEGFDRKLCQTYLPVDQLELEHLLSEAVSYARGVSFKVLFGLVKELTLANDKIIMNAPSKMREEKFQAFILKRKEDEITSKEDDYFVNGKKLDLSFRQYKVTILDVGS